MKKAKELSRIFRDQPQTSLERAIHHVEYVIRHKGAYHLRSGAMNLNVLQYNSVDVIAFLLAVSLTIVLLVFYIVKSLVKLLLSSVKSPKMQSGGGGKRKKH